MFTLENKQLSVSLLDPVADRERFGTRYNTGGYIFQIEDDRHGPLLTGPTYPDSFNTFDGQGIPDAFRNPLRSAGSTTGLIPGIGLCDLVADSVLAFCEWDVQVGTAGVTFRTEQAHQGYALTLTRTVRLIGRTVVSTTHLRNSGGPPIPVSWFPHPFYPHPTEDELCWFSVPVRFDNNDGYVLSESGFIIRKNWPWETDYYRPIDHEAKEKLVVLQRHPSVGLAAASFDYVPGFLVIWGNKRTFSFEPFFERTVASGQDAEWEISWHF